jgi:CRP-like cAMP-binding protein
MERKSLVGFIKNILPIPDTVAETIAANFEPFTLSKNDVILKHGKVSNDYMILEEGCIRSFTFNAEGVEVTTNFYMKRSVVFEVASFFKRTPSRETFQALQDCAGWKTNYETIQTLFHTIPEFRELGRMILVNGYVAFKERTLSMIDLTAEQRYEDLIRNRPEIFQHAPLKHVASYLGITDTSLSRIRKEFTNK